MASGDDGSVEIRITGAVDGSVPASAKDAAAQVSKAGEAAAESVAAQSDRISKMVQRSIDEMEAKTKTAQTRMSGGGPLFDKASTPGLFEAQNAAMGLSAGKDILSQVETKTEDVARSTRGLNLATSGAVQEYIRLGHEALTGNFSRMPGSMIVLASRVGGLHEAMASLTPEIIGMGVAAAGTVAALAAVGIATYQYYEQQRALTASTIGLGAVSGVTAAQLREAANEAADASGQSKRATLESAEAFAAAGVRSQAAISGLSASVQTYAELTGQKAADAQKALATAMKDPIKGAEELNDQLGILDSTQLEQIRTMVDAGDKTGAVNLITKALKERVDEANQSGVGLNSTFGEMGSQLSNLWNKIGQVTNAFLDLDRAQRIVAGSAPFGGFFGGGTPVKSNESDIQRRARLNTDSAAGSAIAGSTPEGQDRARREALVGSLATLRTALSAETQLHGANSEAAQRDAAAIAEYSRAIRTFLPEAEKKHQLAVLDDQLEKARHSRDSGKVADLTRQRTELSMAGQVASQGDVSQAASDAAAKAGDRVGGAKSHGPSVVSEWAEQLHAQEIASGEFFKDQTANELAFWQGKLGLTKAGSKEWLQVQSHIYEAQKTLAHDSYDDELASMNEQLQATRENWTKQKVIWDQKLEFIADHYGKEGKEYKDAFRQFEADQQQHDDRMEQQQRQAEQRQIDNLKTNLATQRQIRETSAQSAISVAQSTSTSPFEDVRAAIQSAQIHTQLAQQEIADAKQVYDAQSALADNQIQKDLSRYGADDARYLASLEKKKSADQQYFAQKAALESRAEAQQIQGILAVQQRYHSYIDGMVSSTVSGFAGVLTRQQTWAQAVMGIYNSILGTFERMLEKMISNWIIKHVFMTALERQQLAAQTAQVAASQVAKTAAVAVGTEAQVAATAVGAAQSSAIVGAHNLKEITSHAATAAAAAYHAMAGIPIVGPVLGAAAAAATFAAVEGFGVMASLEQGSDSLPRDMLVQAHEGERIMPKADNRALMEALTGGGRKGGDTHLNYSPQLSGDTKPFRQQLLDHSSDLLAMVNRWQRDGALRT